MPYFGILSSGLQFSLAWALSATKESSEKPVQSGLLALPLIDDLGCQALASPVFKLNTFLTEITLGLEPKSRTTGLASGLEAKANSKAFPTQSRLSWHSSILSLRQLLAHCVRYRTEHDQAWKTVNRRRTAT